LQVQVDLSVLALVMETRLRAAEAAAIASRARQDSVETSNRVADESEDAEGMRREEIANRVQRKMDGIRMAQMYRIAAGDLRASVLNGEQPLMVNLEAVLQLLQTPRTFLPAATVVNAATVFPCDHAFQSFIQVVDIIYLAAEDGILSPMARRVMRDVVSNYGTGGTSQRILEVPATKGLVTLSSYALDEGSLRQGPGMV
jgi:hypothetical protein